jgi:gluconokinase
VNGAPEVILGVDVGTTAVKVAAFDVHTPGELRGDLSPLPAAIREYPLEQPEPTWQVQDPLAVLVAVDEALAECAARLGGSRILALSVSAAQHGLVGLDRDLRPVTPLITWADARSADEARELRRSGQADDLLRRTGTPVHAMSPLVKLVWFARHQPALAARVRWWLGLKDLVLEHLTGRVVTELSSASATGLLNLERRDWDPAAVALAGIETEQLPPVLATTSVLALTPAAAHRVGGPAGRPWRWAPRTGRWATSARERSRQGWRVSPSVPAARSGWPSPSRATTRPAGCSATRSPPTCG